jgi:hypothetical protein
MDIKRVAFETRPVQSKRPAIAAQPTASQQQPATARSTPAAPSSRASGTPQVSRQEIAAIVDRFLANRPAESNPPALAPPASQSDHSTGGNGGAARARTSSPSQSSSNGHKAAEFVSEDDVKRALQKGEKIYVGPRTIITPSARDIGDPAEVFAKI